jgi:predicted dehydrogenase
MTVRVGLVGAGRRARDLHAPALARCPGITFVGLWSRSPKLAADLATAYDVTAFDRYEDLLDNVEAVDFAVPPPVQAELATAAARRHKPVLLEAPIAGDLAGAEELAAAVQLGHVVSQVALIWRFSPAVRAFLSMEVPRTRPQGGIGTLMSNQFAGDSRAASWRKDRGVLHLLGPHLVDLLDAALGPVVDVSAHGDRHGWVGLQMDHQVGRFSEVSMSATVAVEHDRTEVEVFGPGGTAAIDCSGPAPAEAETTLFSEFATCVAEGKPHELDVQRGLHLQRVVEAAETALLIGRAREAARSR